MKNTDFIKVLQWVPSTELLNHPAVKAGITHCGFNALLEFIAAGVPVLTFPHVTDQSVNASLLVETGAALELIPSNLAVRPATEVNMTYAAPVFNEQVLANKVVEILVNHRYAERMGGL